MKIFEILEHLNRKEWVLPPFQRDFVWNDKEKIIKFVDSLYRDYPIGSIIIWKPHEEDIKEEIRGRPIDATVSREPLWTKKYILDGQQRLTTICRIFNGDPFVFKGREFILHFDVKNEKFCFLEKGEKRENCIPFHEIIHKKNEELLEELKLKEDSEKFRAISLFEKVRQIKDKEISLETTHPLRRTEALDLFIRLNTGGKPLATENLALGYISIRWPDVRDELEKFRNNLQKTGFKFDFDFFVRCLSAFSLGQSLKRRIVPEFGKKNMKDDWEKIRKGIARLIDFLRGELNIHSNRFIEAENVLIPLVLIFSRENVTGGRRSLLAYAFIISYLNRRYSGGKFGNLDRDIKLIIKSTDPVEAWVDVLEKDRGTLKHLEPSDIVEDSNKTFKLPFYLLLKSKGVTKDLLGRNFVEIAASEENRPEFHHIFPKRWLKRTKFEKDKDHIANLTILTSLSNKEILGKNPTYLCEVSDRIKEWHLIPKDKELYKVEKYMEFIKKRQELIASSLNQFLKEKKLKR